MSNIVYLVYDIGCQLTTYECIDVVVYPKSGTVCTIQMKLYFKYTMTVTFMMYKVALEQIFSEFFRFTRSNNHSVIPSPLPQVLSNQRLRI
jgi:hypothetical protein